jgi:RNA polymerase sigma-70 factor (ECF subfamily)
VAEWDWMDVRAECLRVAQGVLGSTTSAEDAAQEAAVRAWRRRGACRTPERPEPWIAAIARNEALRVVKPTTAEPLEAIDELPGPAHDDDVLVRTDVQRALDELGGVDRGLIFGRFWEDLDYRQLAGRHGVTEGTARVRLHRAVARLREALVET